jgi:CRP-like cAMP-binding protein
MWWSKLWKKKVIVHFHAFSPETTINGKYQKVYKYLFEHANKDEMTMNSDKNAYFLSLPEITELSVPPKTILLEEGKVADRMYLIRKGCLRLFFNNEGRDITFQFFFEGDFVASFDSLYQRTPSLFSLESIEPAELSVMKREDFFRNLGQKPALRQIYEEKIIERFHVYQRLFLSRIKNTPQQRYEELLKEHPSIIQRIPQHYIASYLGITSVSLSRIRNRR